MPGFYKGYFLLAVILFAIEVYIGTYMHDAIIRPYGGDFLVVILIYCFVKSFFNTSPFVTACRVLAFAYVVEVSQYFHLVTLLGWEHSKAAAIIMGTSFSFTDLLMYTLGIGAVLLLEKLLHHERSTKN
ncbi:MAG: ribosomal maturation YjgA family protein [Mucilaginibacter sp.]